MKIIFATTNIRKIEDMEKVIEKNKLPIEILTLNDIGWDKGEIEETGQTLEENSLIKAKAVYDFCINKNISFPIISDDSGLFVKSLNEEPGIYTARYADEELKNNPNLPKYECVNKLLRNLENSKDRTAEYRCVVTCLFEDEKFIQKSAITKGSISFEITEPIKKPYFYSVFFMEKFGKNFNLLCEEELYNTYRFLAIEEMLLELKYDNQLIKS